MWYSLDVKKLGKLLLPTFLRKPLIKGYLDAMLHPLSKLYQRWLTLREDNLYTMAHNGQVCYMRKALNDTLDPSERRIYIDDGNKFVREYIYTPGENKTRYLGKISLFQSLDYADTGADFIVFAPIETINNQIDQLKALIEFYKLGGKRYKIESI
ncbi:hypothetical protein [Aquimarina algiphila]|uniref:hypothetical protein n=1 Tax=Aquimarina algiphila TaxID=2047982 RepID=UPI00232B619A|nr:hypothetical protein [Aquimarina algiphila]